MITPGKNILALCSGGVDSTVLVDKLASIRHKSRPRSIHVLHLDHGYRSNTTEAAAEAEAAARIADRHNLPFHIITRNFDTHPAAPKKSKQDDARSWRYQTAIDLATTLGCDFIVTGHNADDNIETALLNFVGLTPSPAMQETAPLPNTPIRLHRPLLRTSRADIEAHARENGLLWSDDPTNADSNAYKRNTVRHELLPALRKVNPDAGSVIAKNAALVADMRTAIGDMAAIMLDQAQINSLQLNLKKITCHSLPVQRAIISEWLHNILPESRAFNHRTVNEVVGIANNVAGKQTSLSGGLVVTNIGGSILSAEKVG